MESGANPVSVVRVWFGENHSERNNMTETSRPGARDLISLGICYMISRISQLPSL